MVFGIFKTRRHITSPKRENSVKETQPVKPAPAPVVEPQQAPVVKNPYFQRAGHVVEIMLIGPSDALIEDYLASMQIDMSRLSANEGLAFYTQDLWTITRTVGAKKRLENCFMDDEALPYIPLREKNEQERQAYVYEISPAGRQDHFLGLSLNTYTPETLRTMPEEVQAVWVLLPEPVLSFKVRHYLDALQPFLDKLTLPLIYLVGYFEKKATFRHNDHLDTNFVASLQERCRSLSGSRYTVVPVQIYGGLSITGWQSVDEPIFDLNENGYQQYQPIHCALPLLLLIHRQKDHPFFSSTEGQLIMEGLMQSLHKLTCLSWQVGEEDENEEDI